MHRTREAFLHYKSRMLAVMTARDLIEHEIDHIGFQLTKSFEGMQEKDLDTRCCPSGMTAREIMEHLCEVYVAADKICAGGQHEWGSYSIDDKSWDNLQSQFKALRAKAKAAALSGSDEAITAGHDYIVAHDAYHVGQMALIRMETDKGWDPYSLYTG